jgi:hypothetical protein
MELEETSWRIGEWLLNIDVLKSWYFIIIWVFNTLARSSAM